MKLHPLRGASLFSFPLGKLFFHMMHPGGIEMCMNVHRPVMKLRQQLVISASVSWAKKTGPPLGVFD